MEKEKEKKMIIILSVTSGVLLLLLLISSGFNYKQYNDNNTCTSSSKNLKSSGENVLGKQQSQLKELINVMSSKNPDRAAGIPTSDQIDCLLKQLYQKYTPFDILYNIISFFFASMSNMVVENKGTTPWSSSLISTLLDMRNVGCSSLQTCNIPSSSELVRDCQKEFK